MDNKVLLIGLDGADPDLLFKWVEEGELPNLGRLIKEGTSGDLKTTYPPMTAPAWTALMTGKNPGKTGVFDFIQKTTGKYEQAEFNPTLGVQEGGVDFSLITANMIKNKKLWEIINEAGKKVGIMHVPMTYPPDKVDGFFVSGMGTPGPESNFTHPPELRNTLINEMGYKIHVSYLNIDGIEDKSIADLHSTEEKRCKAAVRLMNEHEWDFFMLVFEGTDYVQHFFWKFMDPKHPHYDPEKAKQYGDTILNYYKKVDSFLGRIFDQVGDDTVIMIMSDHGGGPVYKKFIVNKWLMDRGLLALKSDNRHFRIMSRLGLNKELMYAVLIKFIPPRLIEKIPSNIRKKVPRKNYNLNDFDWSKTKVFSLTGWGMIYINLKGREPQGIVEPGAEYEELRDLLINELKNLKDPVTGQNLVSETYKREELYSGEYIDQAPDLVFWMESIECLDEIPPSESRVLIDSDKRKSGTHRMKGIFLASGNGVKKNLKVEGTKITDLAPTILYVMGIPVYDDMDGDVMANIFTDDFIINNEIIYKKTEEKDVLVDRSNEIVLSGEDEAKIKERLRALGYMD